MDGPRIVGREEWLKARRALLSLEKASSRQRDALAAERRKLPMVEIDTKYVFDGPTGPKTLLDLFGGRRQLIVYHFMFEPQADAGCKYCSHLMDGAAGCVVHLTARDTSLVVVSRAPLSKIEAFKERMGWDFPWYSSFGTDFNNDFAVTLDPERAPYEYNYTDVRQLLATGKIWIEKGELSGISVFLRDGDRVFHTYSAYQRGSDVLLNTYNFLDLTPLGRQEEHEPIMGWVRYHDQYPA